MLNKIYATIMIPLRLIRNYLNSIREKSPATFDKAVKAIQFFIPFIGCFAPALISKFWLRIICEFILLSAILVFQWSTYTNRIIGLDKKIEELNESNRKQRSEIDELKKDRTVYDDLLGANEIADREKIIALNKQLDDLAGFSHSVSDNVKKIVAEITNPVDIRTAKKITNFLQQSLTSLEKILTNHYSEEIRASIKMTIGEDCLKTYARGRNNINSRGGEYRCSELNNKTINISENYAYLAIVLREQQFFAEGNLLEMHNKFDKDDTFFCEYGDDYIDMFVSTVIMPIRIPVFRTEGKPAHSFEVLGLVCIDCPKEISEWSDDNLREKRAYRIIADYADTMAMLFKEYRDENETKTKAMAEE